MPKHPAVASARSDIFALKAFFALGDRSGLPFLGEAHTNLIHSPPPGQGAMMKRLGKELVGIRDKLPEQITSIEADPANLLLWTGIMSPAVEPYNVAAWAFELEFPAEYPFKAPTLTFKTPILHPNFDEKGAVCLPIIAEDKWKPAIKVAQVLAAAVKLVNEPEPDHPLRAELAETFTKDRAKFNKDAKAHSAKHGLPRPT